MGTTPDRHRNANEVCLDAVISGRGDVFMAVTADRHTMRRSMKFAMTTWEESVSANNVAYTCTHVA